ncbi:MAG: hypothetical protein ACYDAV_04425 [Gammaproteobacteria bacterium]
MNIQREKSRIQEKLSLLYLRLNGFFVVPNFIAHSPEDARNRAEIDALAVRFPHHTEPEVQVASDKYLELSTEHIDFVLCEVKSRESALQFNDSLLSRDEPLASALRWSGLFLEHEVMSLTQQLRAVIQPSDKHECSIPTVLGPRQTRVRALLCCPEIDKHRRNQPWFIPGPIMFEFFRKRFCDEQAIRTCAKNYNLELWADCEGIVRFFKEGNRSETSDMNALYGYLGIA